VDAKDTKEKLYFDGGSFFPSTVYYSGKNVKFVQKLDPPYNTLKGAFLLKEKPFLLITEKWRLETDKIQNDKYKILSEREKYLLLEVVN
jgi:hypothetical protein